VGKSSRVVELFLYGHVSHRRPKRRQRSFGRCIQFSLAYAHFHSAFKYVGRIRILLPLLLIVLGVVLVAVAVLKP